MKGFQPTSLPSVLQVKDMVYGEWFRFTPNGARWHLLIADPRRKHSNRRAYLEVCVSNEQKDLRWVDDTLRAYPCEAPALGPPGRSHESQGQGQENDDQEKREKRLDLLKRCV